ncbi:TetR/AcrR family transcriptional regulator [Heyndrickxia ginsengihumi]|uniref:TetR/AcrR family transcriptional regulator n=1 Tax=Heyndrickxia ginsengihumi TaxID=363870 RepID=UPI003D1A7E9F
MSKSPGRPRSKKSKQAIIEATISLLESSGYHSLTMEAIANQAGAGKATIYRWWVNKAELVMEAFKEYMEPQVQFEDTNHIREDFRRQLYNLKNVFDTALGRTVIEIIVDNGTDPKISESFSEFHLQPRRKEAKRILDKGIKRGEIKESIDKDIVLDMLYAPVYFRILISKQVIDAVFIDTLLDSVMNAIKVPS